jgi:putative flippase GtrA
MGRMSDLERRGSYTPRRVREQRAYRFAMVGGVAGVVGAVGLVLAIFGVVGAGIPILALIVAAICVFLFRRTVSA